MKDTQSLHIYTDGGARGNPGPAACAFVVMDQDGKSIFEGGKLLGIQTNNIAEYHGVIQALEWLKQNLHHFPHITTTEFFLDSLLVVSQLSGKYKIKNSQLKNLQASIQDLVIHIKLRINYHHIPRHLNYKADRLLNRLLDSA